MSAEGAIGKAISARSAEDLPDEEKQGADDERAWQELLARISRQSITKHFQAYVAVPWDDPDCAIDRADPRLALPETDPLGATAWYRAQPESVRAAIDLHMLTTFLKIGVQFESTLKRGLLEYAALLRARPAAAGAHPPGALLRLRARRRGPDRPRATRRAAPR